MHAPVHVFELLKKIVRAIVGVVGGIGLGVLLIMAAEAWLLTLQPPPDSWQLARPQAYTNWLESLNFRHHAMLLAAWTVAGAAGGLLAASLARHPAAGWICGLALAGSAILLTSLVAHPYWLSALLIIAPLAGSVCGSHVVNTSIMNAQR